MAPLSQFHIRILLNGPQDARPGKNRFAYAESPAKQRHDRELPDTAHNPNELGRIRILLPVVYNGGSMSRRGMNEIGCKPAQTVAELASARQHQENPAGHHGARGGG